MNLSMILHDNCGAMSSDKTRLMYVAGEILSQSLDEADLHKR